MAEMAMFPLGMVLFPGAVLPLHVFEPRYRALVAHCLSTPDHEFGVVLIERGHEVGGGDVRTNVGTVARMVEVGELPDGRYALVTVGTRRLRVSDWLDDDPFPRAIVEHWPDEAPSSSPADLEAAYSSVTATLRRVLALSAELGRAAVPATVELTSEPTLGAYQAAALAPLGPLDQQRLLAAPGPSERLHLLGALLVDCDATLTLELWGG
jgi:Lon protease-like protein